MAFSIDENDAIGEVTNIFAGAVACSFSNITDADINISVPIINQWHEESSNLNLSDKTYGYSFRSTSFFGGYCILDIEKNPEYFNKMLGNDNNEPGLISHIVYKVIQTAIEPLELMLGQSLSVDTIKEMDDAWSANGFMQKGDYITVDFEVLIDEEINGVIKVIYPENVAKVLASRFLSTGIAVTTV